MKTEDKFIIALCIAFLCIVFWFIVYDNFHTYEIKDTVYVPDSITVTMTMEEWNEFLAWQVQDSLWVRWNWGTDSIMIYRGSVTFYDTP